MTAPDTQPSTHIYSGETRPRNPVVAAFITFLSPGLGYVYCGQLLKGVAVNLMFWGLLVGFLAIFAAQKFFPLVPLLVIVSGWFIFSTLHARVVTERIKETEAHAYKLKSYNHWMMYSVIFFLSYLAPIAATLHWSSQTLWHISPVENSAMYPTIQPGEVVLIDRTAYKEAPPERGDIVAVEVPGQQGVSLLRVVGVQQDVIRMGGDALYVNDELVPSSPLKPEYMTHGTLDDDADLLAWVEYNQDQRYVISVSPHVISDLTIPPTSLSESELFLLADNRSQIPLHNDAKPIRDSRVFGPVHANSVLGKPMYIAWSVHPLTSSTRWERIGLRTE